MPWVIREGKPVKVSVTVQRDVVVPKPAPVEVPKGSIQVVVDWVGDDAEKARAALRAERQSDNPRTTLIEVLDRIV